MRDVFRLYDYRLGLMLTEDDPLYPNWDQDETAVADDYASQSPAVVADELDSAADAIAASFAAVSGDQWLRPGRRSDGASFTVETFARYFMHDPIHHLHDVTGVPPRLTRALERAIDAVSGARSCRLRQRQDLTHRSLPSRPGDEAAPTPVERLGDSRQSGADVMLADQQRAEVTA